MMIVENRSSMPQKRWARLCMPTQMADAMPWRGTLDGLGWRFARTKVRSFMSTLCFVEADLGAGEIHRGNLHVVPDDTESPPLQLSRLVTDDLAGAIPFLSVLSDVGFEDPIEVRVSTAVVVHESPIHKCWLLTGFNHGFLLKIYATAYQGQDVIDFKGTITYSDRHSNADRSPTMSLALRCGEPFWLRFKTRAGWKELTVAQGTGGPIYGYELPFHKIPDGIQIPFEGALLPEPDDGTVMGEFEADRIAAAGDGQVLAMLGYEWDGYWFSHQSIAWDDVWPKAVGLRSWPVDLNAAGSVFEQRPWANARDTGRTGAQECFGRTKGLRALAANTCEGLEQLAWSGQDYLLRCHHHLDLSGQRWTFREHPQALTWNAYVFRAVAQHWNRPNQDPPWGWDHGGRGFIDDQHRGGLFVWALTALTMDETLLDGMLDLTETDLARAKGVQGVMDASRATGRLLQDWAAMWHLCPFKEVREALMGMARRELQMVMQQPSYNHDGEVHVGCVMSGLDQKNPLRGTDAWFPWQESMLCDGLLAWAQLCPEEPFEAVAVNIGTSVLNYGITANGLVVAACKWNEGGKANPPEYLMVPRPGASTAIPSATQPPIDLLYGGISRYWYSGAMESARLNNDAAVHSVARDFGRRWYAAPATINECEWVAGLEDLRK